MTVFSAQPTTRPSDVWPLPIPDGTGAAALPERLPALLLQYPRLAVRIIHRGSVQDPLLLAVLRAELHLHLGDRRTAASNALEAISRAYGEKPPSPRRLLLTVRVHADIAGTLDDPGTLALCDQLRLLADAHGDHRDRLLADAVHAVAIYQHLDCQRGRHALQQLHDLHHDEPLTTVISEGLTAMHELCTYPHPVPPLLTTRLDPPAGGLLHSDLDQPPTGYLRSRIAARGGKHTCRPRRRFAVAAATRIEQARP